MNYFHQYRNQPGSSGLNSQQPEQLQQGFCYPMFPYFILVPLYNPVMGNPMLPMNGRCISQTEVDYRNDMRSRWEAHVAWTRMAIISLVFDLPDIDEVISRLLKNADDMGDMIRRLYGDEVATTYSQLIRDHLLIAADLVNAAIAGDAEAAQEAEARWYENADDIARFLNSVNPYLTEEAVREMFYEHLALTKQEAIFMINQQFEEDIAV